MAMCHLVVEHALFLTDGGDDLVDFVGHFLQEPVSVLYTGGANGVALLNRRYTIKSCQIQYAGGASEVGLYKKKIKLKPTPFSCERHQINKKCL